MPAQTTHRNLPASGWPQIADSEIFHRYASDREVMALTNPRTNLLRRARLWLVGAVAVGTGASVAFTAAAAANQQDRSSGSSGSGTGTSNGSPPDDFSGGNSNNGTGSQDQGTPNNNQQGGSGFLGLFPGGGGRSHGSSHAS